jgi:hypothetical protein
MVLYRYCVSLFAPQAKKDTRRIEHDRQAKAYVFFLLLIGIAIGGRLSQQRVGLSNTKGSYRSSCPS